jgi:hypothetical protein
MSLPNLDAFKSVFKGDLVTPSDPDYDKAIARWAVNAQRRAALVTYPKDAPDVAETIKWVSANNIPVAVCGGGHSSSGASSVEDGVVIALSRYMGGATVDPEHKLAFVGGGAVWAAVDKAGIEHELATVRIYHYPFRTDTYFPPARRHCKSYRSRRVSISCILQLYLTAP